MFGVASLLCRLGLRWRMNAPQASYSISHLMATLVYMSPNGDGKKLVVYSSDPVLALGATKVWHGCRGVLSGYILPEFKRLLLEEVLDVDNVNEGVTCVVLLLAMDTCVVIETNSASHFSCPFMGQFFSVDLFVKVLGGQEPPLMLSRQTAAPNQNLGNAFENWRSRWADWKLGFCHFIQLEFEPDENTLWYLLGRRAAGIFAREQDKVDLIIPIFRESEVSVILIQVGGTKDRRGGCPEKDIQLMDPFCVFSEGNSLRLKQYHEIIRISIAFEEPQGTKVTDPDRYFLIEGYESESWTNKHSSIPSTTQEPQHVDNKFTLCILVGRPWDITIGKTTLPIISPDTAAGLIDLTSSKWDITGRVISGLYYRQESEARIADVWDSSKVCWSKLMPDGELARTASYVLPRGDGY